MVSVCGLSPQAPSAGQHKAEAHRRRAAPRAPGLGQPPQRDEASGGWAADLPDRLLGHLPAVHIEPDLGVAHGHVHL